MKKYFIAVAALLLLSGTVLTHAAGSVDQHMNRMEKDLSLTSDQKTKLRPILDEARIEVEKFIRANRDPRKPAILKGLEILARHEKKLEGVLTPGQMRKRAELRKAAWKKVPPR